MNSRSLGFPAIENITSDTNRLSFKPKKRQTDGPRLVVRSHCNRVVHIDIVLRISPMLIQHGLSSRAFWSYNGQSFSVDSLRVVELLSSVNNTNADTKIKGALN